MATNYPGAVDSFVNPTASDTLDSVTVPHAAQHDNANDAIHAVQVTLGVNPQGSAATVVARLDALDSTVAGKVASVSAGDSTVTVAGTATAPTVAVNSISSSKISDKGIANGVASLDGSGLIPTTQLPPLAVNDTFVVASEAAMLALTAEVGDIAVRTDVTKTFILTASPASTLGNWQEILTPPGVTSITASSPLTGGTITSTGTIGLGTVGVANGGTGQTSLNSGEALIGAGTSGVTTTPVTQTGAASSLVQTNSSRQIVITGTGNTNTTISAGSINLKSNIGAGANNVSNSNGALTLGGVGNPGSLILSNATGNSSTINPNGGNTVSLTVGTTSGTIIGSNDTGTVTSTMILDGTIVNDDISSSAAIADTKLATISTFGKVSGQAIAAGVTTITGTSYTVAATDYLLICNNSASLTITLPAASSYTGRILKLVKRNTASIISNASNVTGLTGTAGNTFFVSNALAGKFAEIISDGSTWCIVNNS